ncbi:MAG: redoxin domain-containing protein [Chitinophagaceae bacterium]
MKKIILILWIFASHSSFSQKSNFSISGKIKGLDTKYISLFIYDADLPRGFSQDSIPVKNGSFSYTASVSKFLYAAISPMMSQVVKTSGTGFYPAKSSMFQFFIAPGYKLKFNGEIKDFVDAYPSGEKNNNGFAKLCRVIYPMLNKSLNLTVTIAKKEVTDLDVVKRMKDTIQVLDKKVIELKTQFIRDNPSSGAAAWLLSDMMIRSQVSNAVATEMFNGLDKEKLSNIVYYSEAAKRVEGFSATATGKIVPEISTKNTYSGNQFTLSALRGRYVVLDFWGTWCGPCIAGMPKMKEYLEKYSGKMEIVGVASESDKGERWKKFLDGKPQYQWHHVLSTKDQDYILQFSVAGFPTKMIIDPEGKIVGRYVGEDDVIYRKLDELMK